MASDFQQRQEAAAIAADREGGASELLARLLPLLEAAVRVGPDLTLDIARVVCRGQPAMAQLWNASAAALADFTTPGRFARVRAEMSRAPSALARAATDELSTALAGERTPHLLTLSYSTGVATVLSSIAQGRSLAVTCAVSLPGGEGQRMRDQLIAAGARADLLPDAMLTTYLRTAHAVVVGADAISARGWTNKCGTFGLAAAASFTATPVYVIGSRDKAECMALSAHTEMPPLFERTPLDLATQYLTDTGPVSPADIPKLSERFAPEVEALLKRL